MALAMLLLLSLSASGQELTDFYTYTKEGEGYKVGLAAEFCFELNKASGGEFTSGSYTWKTGDPLPNPAPDGMYKGKKVVSMARMFHVCAELTSLDLSNFNTAEVTDMTEMFYFCQALTSLDLSKFNTANVTNMSKMFYFCQALTSLNLSNINTAKVTDMSEMFYGCNALTSLDLSSFNTANVTDMSDMFSNCDALTSLDLSSFNTANVTDMSGMFYNSYALTSLNLSSFNTAKVTNMNRMFGGCSSLISLDLSSFDFTNVSSWDSMFYECGQQDDLGNPAKLYVKNEEAKLTLNSHDTGIDNTRLTIVLKVDMVTVAVTEAGGATMFAPKALDFSAATKVKAYSVTVNNGKITLTPREKVAAYEAVLLLADGAATEEIPLANETVAPDKNNNLIPAIGGLSALASETKVGAETYYNYILNNGDEGLGFYKANDQQVADGKAYLHLSASQVSAEAKVLTFDFNGNTTAIDQLKADTATTDGAIYNLAGQRVKKAGKGIYIVGGKKVVMK